MGFLKYLNEMAVDSGHHSGNAYSKENDWKEQGTDKRFFKLIKKNINHKDMKLFKTQSSFFLISKDDEYLGHLQVEIKQGKARITGAFSKIQSGFYNIIFTAILAFTEIDEIISDSSLSSNAIKSYENLQKNHNFIIRILKNGEYFDFSKSLLLTPNSVVSIKTDGELSERCERYFKEKIEYNNAKDSDQRWLYGKSIFEMEY